MAPKDVNTSDTDQDNLFPEEFEDDLNEDWESAFKADDFVFSQDDEAGDLFSSVDGGTEDVDLSTLTASEPQKQPPPESTIDGEPPPEEKQKRRFLDLPQWQRVLLLTIPLLTAAAGAWYLFSPRSAPIPAKQEEVAAQPEKATQLAEPAEEQPESSALVEEDDQAPPPAESKDLAFHPLPDTKIRKRYNLPAIFVTAAKKDSEAIFVSVDVTLLLDIAPDQTLTETDKIKASDIIYQFFKNRPAEELADYALNRGKMIQGIGDWVQKNWPQGPLHSVIIESYRVNKS